MEGIEGSTSEWVRRFAVGLVLCAHGIGLAPVGSVARAAELVMFDSASCSWCRRWESEVGIDYPGSDEGQRAPLRRVDIARAGVAGVRLQARVTATPTFVLVEGGTEIGRITGYPGADLFWEQLGQMLAEWDAPVTPARDLERSAALVLSD